MHATNDIYAGQDPRDVPTYAVASASHYLRVSPSTLRSWAIGTRYVTKARRWRRTKPLLVPAETEPLHFSFWNLVEAQVLATIRKVHKIKMPCVRRALDFVEKELGHARPLIGADFKTDGASLFVHHLDQLVDVGAQGGPQLMLKMIEATLERIEADESGLAARIYPWVNEPTEPKFVVLDPRRSFGQPVVQGTRVTVDVLVDRFQAGDGFQDLASDYDIALSKVEYAIRWGMRRVGAA